MGSNKQQLLKNFVTTQLQNAKQQTQPIVNSDGFKNGEPPAGSNWRIPGDNLYNPTPYPIKAVSDNGITKTLNPFDETNVQFPGAQYVDEYQMKFGGLTKFLPGGPITNCPPGSVPDENGNCVFDLSTPPTPESSLFDYYTDLLNKPGMTPEIAGKAIKAKRTCKPGDECWEEIPPTPEVKIPIEDNPFEGMERLYIDLTQADYDKVPSNLKEGTHGDMYIRNRVPYGWRSKDGTVYYEHGVPGTPGYQGKFSGKADLSKYHFVDELSTKKENSNLVTRKYGGLPKYQGDTGPSQVVENNDVKPPLVIPKDAARYGIDSSLNINTPYVDPDLIKRRDFTQKTINEQSTFKNPRAEFEKKVLDSVNRLDGFDVSNAGYLPENLKNGSEYYCISGVCYTLNDAGEPIRYYSNSLAQDDVSAGKVPNWKLNYDLSSIKGGDILQFTGNRGIPHHAGLVVPNSIVKNDDGTLGITLFMNNGNGRMYKETYNINPKTDMAGNGETTQLLTRDFGDSMSNAVNTRDWLDKEILKQDPQFFTRKKGAESRWQTYSPGMFAEKGKTWVNMNGEPLGVSTPTMMQSTDPDVQAAGELLKQRTITIPKTNLSYTFDALNDVDYNALSKTGGFNQILNKVNDENFKLDFMKKFNISNREYNAIVSNTFGIYGQESGFGTKPGGFSETDTARSTDSLYEDLKSRFSGNGRFKKDKNEDYSRGLTQVKLRNIDKDLREKYGITPQSIESNPEAAFLAAMITNAQNLPQLRKLARKGDTKAIDESNYLDFMPYLYSMPGRLRRGDKNTIIQAIDNGKNPEEAIVKDPNSPDANNEYIKNVRTFANMFQHYPTTGTMEVKKFGGKTYKDGGPAKGKEYKTPTGESIYLDPNFKVYARYLDSNGKVIPVTELQKFSMIYDPQSNTWDSTHSEKTLNVYDRRMSYEDRLNKALGDPMGKAERASEQDLPPGEDPTDNFRHPLAGMYTQQAIANKTGNIPIASPVLGWLGANAMGVGHELGTIFNDNRPLKYKGREALEDIFNNAVGASVGLLPTSNEQKEQLLFNISGKNMIPDGISDPNGQDFYFKKNGGLHQYQKAGLTFEELMMQGMRPQSAVQDNTYVANPRIEEARRDQAAGVTPEKKVKAAAAKKKMVAEEKRQELVNQLANQGTISPNTQSDFDRTVQQAYNVVSNPISSLGHYARYGYVPQGNLGNYGLRQDQSPMEMVANSFNPFSWANAAYRFTNDLADRNTYTSGYGALNATLDLLEAAPMLGVMKSGLPSIAQDINIGKRMLRNSADNGLTFLENNKGVFAKQPKMQSIGLDQTTNTEEFARLKEIEKGMAISTMNKNPNRNANLTDFLQNTKLTDEELAPILQGKTKAETIAKLQNETSAQDVVMPRAGQLPPPPETIDLNTETIRRGINLERPAGSGRSQAQRDADLIRRSRRAAQRTTDDINNYISANNLTEEQVSNMLDEVPAFQRRNINIDTSVEGLPRVELFDIQNPDFDPRQFTNSFNEILLRKPVTFDRTKDAVKGLFTYGKVEKPKHQFTTNFYAHDYETPRDMYMDVLGKLNSGLKSMNVGEIGTGATNTSHNSFLNQMDFIAKNAGKQGLSEPIFLGYHDMNPSGYLSQAGIPNEEILKYINANLNKIQTRTGTNFNLGVMQPYIENGRVMLPQYGVKKLGEGFQAIKKQEGGSVLSNFVMSQLQNKH